MFWKSQEKRRLPRSVAGNKPLYVFIDESGDFNFSPSGSKFYIITAVITHFPEEKAEQILSTRHQILAREVLPDLGEDYLEGKLCHRFHATEDKQPVRDIFFGIIQSMESILAHSIVVRKNRTNPTLHDPHRFYSRMVGYLIDYISKRYTFSKLCIILAGTPVSDRKKAFIGAIKSEIKSKQPKKAYSIYFPDSQSELFLQVSDYINWAIYRKWDSGDERSYVLINKFLKIPELDVFKNGDMEYYQFKK